MSGRAVVALLLTVVGFALFLWGLAEIYPPAALVFAGLSLGFMGLVAVQGVEQ